MKKTISLLLCAAMTAGVLSGCGQKDTASETVRTENQEQENTNGAAGQAPKAEEPADNKDAGCDTLWNYRIPEFPSGRSSGSV